MSEAAHELVLHEGEIVEPPPSTSMTLFGTDDPDAFVAHATRSAEVLARVVTDQKLFKQIGKNKHVFVQGWTLLGSMLGVFPVCVWTRKLEDGWEARVEARTRNGEVVGAAEAECLRSESRWAGSDDYAIRSMAQTRATSKALRQPLDFVMTLAGFNATPAEEMPRDDNTRGRPRHAAAPSREDALVALKEIQPKLARMDKSWTQESIFSHVAAQTGEPVRKWEDLPDEAVQQLLKAARQIAGHVEEALGV